MEVVIREDIFGSYSFDFFDSFVGHSKLHKPGRTNAGSDRPASFF
jgi:hypothetical protein